MAMVQVHGCIFRGMTKRPGLSHNCTMACKGHETKRSATEDIAHKVCDAITGAIPSAPAFNKFNKIFGPLSWVTAFVNLPSQLGVRAFADIAESRLSPYSKHDDYKAVEGHKVGVSLSTSDYQVAERVRLRKSVSFLQSDIVNDKMVTCTLALRPLMDILGKHFTASKLDDTGMNLLDWVVEGPVLAAVDRYFQFLSQPGHVVRIANM